MIYVCQRAEALALPEAIVTPGVTVGSKKPDGYVIVMRDEAVKLVAATKLTVIGTPAFLAARSEGAITNDAMVTWPPILPELTPELAKSSDISTVTPVGDPALGPPSWHPVIVIAKLRLVYETSKLTKGSTIDLRPGANAVMTP